MVLGCVAACGPSLAPGDGTDANSTGTAEPTGAADTSSPSSSSSTSKTDTSDTAGTSVDDSSADSSTGAVPCVPEQVDGDCSVRCQDCAPDEKCDPPSGCGLDFGAPQCIEVPRSAAGPGDPCETSYGKTTDEVDSCAPGLKCTCDLYSPDRPYPEACREICTTPLDGDLCTSASERCMWSGPAANYGVCVPICDPLGDTPCTDLGGLGVSCQPFGSQCSILADPDCHPVGSHGVFACSQDTDLDGGPHGYGAPCTWEKDCEEYDEILGWTRDIVTCVPAALVPGCAAERCCTRLCDLTDTDPDASCPGTAGGEACLPYFQPAAAPPGLAHVGICRLP